jgi:hypothetical protein
MRRAHMKRKTKSDITKADLIRAVENTYDDSRFLIGRGLEDGCDFTKTLSLYRSEFISKPELLGIIKTGEFDSMPTIPGHGDSLVLSGRLYLYKGTVNDNQVFRTLNVPEGYIHSVCKYNPHFEIYINLNKEDKTISFLLGDKQKKLVLAERSEFVSKPVGGRMLCVDADSLEHHIHDESWNPRMIDIGRYVLGISSVI